MKVQLFGEQPKDAGTRKLAAKLALRGHALTPTQIHDPSLPYCDDPIPIQREVRSGGYDKALSVTMYRPCRRCEKCLLFRQMKWRERALREIERANRSWFITLTFAPAHLAGILAESQNEKGQSAERRIDNAAYRHVQRYLKRLRKTTKTTFRYLCVFERGEESGRAHYHVLLHENDRPITKAVIEAQWRSHVHCRLVASGRGAASYITKYATKSLDVKPRASTYYGDEDPDAHQNKRKGGNLASGKLNASACSNSKKEGELREPSQLRQPGPGEIRSLSPDISGKETECVSFEPELETARLATEETGPGALGTEQEAFEAAARIVKNSG